MQEATFSGALWDAVCRKWRDLANDTSFTRRAFGSINDAIQSARAGDTLIIPSGFYTVGSCHCMCMSHSQWVF